MLNYCRFQYSARMFERNLSKNYNISNLSGIERFTIIRFPQLPELFRHFSKLLKVPSCFLETIIGTSFQKVSEMNSFQSRSFKQWATFSEHFQAIKYCMFSTHRFYFECSWEAFNFVTKFCCHKSHAIICEGIDWLNWNVVNLTTKHFSVK